MKKALWLLLILAVLGVIYTMWPKGTSAPVSTSTAPTSTPVTAPVKEKILPYGAVKLVLGERAHFADLAITPTALVEDSRCPAGVYCIQAGTVRLKLSINTSEGTTTQTLALGQSISSGDVKITLTSVAPLKTASRTIANSQYEFTFRVERQAASTAPATPPTASAGCYVGGCSKEICSSDPNTISTCIYSPAYACYKTATCERQSNGQCGWTQTPELQMCLAQNSGSSAIQ